MEKFKKIPSEWKKQLLRLLWLLLIPAAFLIKRAAELNPGFAESYANTVFPVIGGAVSSFTGLFPFSLIEFVIYFIIAAVIIFIAIQVYRAFRHKFSALLLVRGLITMGIITGAFMCAFYLMWGFNYYRKPVGDIIGLERKQHEPQELLELCASLAAAANEIRPNLAEDETGVFKLSNDALAEIPAAYAELGKTYDSFSRAVPAPKPVLSSTAMSKGGITGIFIPFTEEANVNMDQPDLLLASSAAHETAHQLGIAREDEANFVSFLACLKSASPEVKYSGIVLALIHAGNALNDISPEVYSKLAALYCDGLKRDLDAHNAYWKQYEGKTSEKVEQLNDNYLKSHSQSQGVLSYGRMVDLLLDYFSDVRQSQNA